MTYVTPQELRDFAEGQQQWVTPRDYATDAMLQRAADALEAALMERNMLRIMVEHQLEDKAAIAARIMGVDVEQIRKVAGGCPLCHHGGHKPGECAGTACACGK